VTPTSHGGYVTTTPTKWISANGRTMWRSSNFWNVQGLPDTYEVSLRRITLTPAP
jgi:hypothetical protein